MNDANQTRPQTTLPPIEGDAFCPNCGYNLRSLTSDRCPECGDLIDRELLGRSGIPWTHRRQIGRFRAYWATVLTVTFRNERFCRESARPVDYRDAQLFRWITCLHVYLPFLLLTAGVYAFAHPWWIARRFFDLSFGLGLPDMESSHGVLSPRPQPVFEAVWWTVWPIVGAHVGFLLTLAWLTGLPSYFFHPRKLSVGEQDSCIALSYYAPAPLAWTPLTILAIFLDPLAHRAGIIFYIPHVLLAIQLICWLACLLLMLKRSAGRGPLALLAFAVGFPVVSILVGGLTIIGISAIFTYFWLICVSFRA